MSCIPWLLASCATFRFSCSFIIRMLRGRTFFLWVKFHSHYCWLSLYENIMSSIYIFFHLIIDWFTKQNQLWLTNVKGNWTKERIPRIKSKQSYFSSFCGVHELQFVYLWQSGDGLVVSCWFHPCHNNVQIPKILPICAWEGLHISSYQKINHFWFFYYFCQYLTIRIVSMRYCLDVIVEQSWIFRQKLKDMRILWFFFTNYGFSS